RATGEAVAEVVRRAAPHGERVTGVAVPVADVDAVAGAPVGEGQVRVPGPAVGQVVVRAPVVDLPALAGSGRGNQEEPCGEGGAQRASCCHVSIPEVSWSSSPATLSTVTEP